MAADADVRHDPAVEAIELQINQVCAQRGKAEERIGKAQAEIEDLTRREEKLRRGLRALIAAMNGDDPDGS